MRTLDLRMFALIFAGFAGFSTGCVIQANDYRALQGAACDAGSQCVTNYCSGVCCNAACDGTCEACMEDITGVADGICAPLALGEPDPGHECDNLGGCGASNSCGCDDGRLGPGESDVDCGGVCPTPCMVGQQCFKAADCPAEAACVEGVCCKGCVAP